MFGRAVAAAALPVSGAGEFSSAPFSCFIFTTFVEDTRGNEQDFEFHMLSHRTPGVRQP
jgi:hypothetical protein